MLAYAVETTTALSFFPKDLMKYLSYLNIQKRTGLGLY